MYFLWRDTPYGFIKVSCEGLLNFVNDTLKSKLRLYSVALSPLDSKSELIENADITIVISDEDLKPEKKSIVEDHLTEVLKPMGMKALIVWATPEKGISQFLQNPVVWALIASCAAVIITAGFDGFFWTAFWGASAWFLMKGFSVLVKKIKKVK